jgi:hypothetical protein
MAITHLDRERKDVFRALGDPRCRFVLLRPVATAYDSWRGAATLAPKFLGRIKAWPVEATLRPGISLGPDQGLKRWDAERAVAGLLTGEPAYIDLAAQILEANAGCSLDLPGDATALLVAERDFSVAVHVGEPVHLSGSLLN